MMKIIPCMNLTKQSYIKILSRIKDKKDFRQLILEVPLFTDRIKLKSIR